MNEKALAISEVAKSSQTQAMLEEKLSEMTRNFKIQYCPFILTAAPWVHILEIRLDAKLIVFWEI